MSRRDSYSKRHRSKFHPEPSPKRSRRDGKQTIEQLGVNLILDKGDHSDRDQKHQHRVKDAFPLKAPSTRDPMLKTETVINTSNQSRNGRHEGTNLSYGPNAVLRSQLGFQNDDRGNVVRNFGRKEATGTTGKGAVRGKDKPERGWWRNPKEQQSEGATGSTVINEKHKRNDNSHVRGNDNRAKNRRPLLGKKKLAKDSESVNKSTAAADEALYVGSQGYRPSGVCVKKWKHDLFDED